MFPVVRDNYYNIAIIVTDDTTVRAKFKRADRFWRNLIAEMTVWNYKCGVAGSGYDLPIE
jgi:hypothetical protein